MRSDFDIAIIGSGFGGSLLSMIAKRLGRSVVLLERGSHPRFAIGESSTPLANLLLEELCKRYELPRLLPLCKWGTWQKNYPSVACGLKRGFTFYHHTFGEPWIETPDHRNQLLVAASPHDGIADTHWYRPDFDHFLVREAQSLGVEYLDHVTLEKPETTPGGSILNGHRNGKPINIKASLLIDASGGRGFLHQVWKIPAPPCSHMPPTQALYTHFTRVRRLDEVCPLSKVPPYPVDDAAVHHIFDGGWIWVLRFNNGIASCGVAATSELGAKLRLQEGAPAWDRLLEQLPALREQFTQAKAVHPFTFVPQLSFRSSSVSGRRWTMLPSSAGFVDPLLSTGFPLTLLGIERLARIIQERWGLGDFDARLRSFAQDTALELDLTEQLVAALYANMNDFSIFRSLSLLYFAAASFSETARRLHRPALAGSHFLLRDNDSFVNGFLDCCATARAQLSVSEKAKLEKLIRKTIEPFDVAGLSEVKGRNWFPVDPDDLYKASSKLKANREELDELLVRCGFIKEKP